jgi:hypothetical protein
MYLLLQLDNNIILKLGIQQPTISFCMFCSLQYWLLWNLYFFYCVLYFWPHRQSIVLFWAYLSVQSFDKPICKTKYCWRYVDADFHNRVMYMSCTVSVGKAATISYINHCHIAAIRLAKMQEIKSFTLHWYWFSGWGSNYTATDFASKGGQYLIYAWLQPITS